MDNCIECSVIVGNRQEAVSCDSCDRWQHRTCNTGITRARYRRAVKMREDIPFLCRGCDNMNIQPPVQAPLNSTSMSASLNIDPIVHDVDVSSLNEDVTIDTRADESHEEEIESFQQDVGVQSDDTNNMTVADRSEESHESSLDSSQPQMQSKRVDRSFSDPTIVHERSLVDQQPPQHHIPDQPTTYEVVTRGSQKGKDILVASDGYSYVVKYRRPRATTWRCTVHNTRLVCSAVVIERGGVFASNNIDHVHPPDPTRELKAKVSVKAKSVATRDTARSAAVIVSEAKEGVDLLTGVANIRQDYIARAVNRVRQDLRPEEPTDMEFELDRAAMPLDFYRREVTVDGKRHLIFATDDQLHLLRQARRWYIDGTFQVMRRPFNMLLTIHAFVRRGDCSKQIPLIFIAMSGRTSKDYARVFKAIQRGLEGEEEVEEIVTDFEAAIWKAAREVFPAVSIKGCFFHWGQAVFRKVQRLGLATEYMQHGGTHALIGMLFVIPFLPHEHILETFTHMDEFNTVERLQPLFHYIRTTWIESALWPVESWCVFGQSIRTNNDVEGWHRRLNLKGGVAPAFYNLVKLLYREAMEAGDQVQLVGEMRLRRMQRKSVRTTQARIFAAWDSYRNDEVSTTGLLKMLSGIYRPRLEKRFGAINDE